MVAGDVLETELVGEVVFQPLLDLQDRRVMVQLLTAEADTPWGVAALYFVEGIRATAWATDPPQKRSIR